MGISFRSHNLGFNGRDMIWWWPGSALRRFRATARDLHMAVHNHVFASQRRHRYPGGPQGHNCHCRSEILSAHILEYPHVSEYPHVRPEYPHVRKLYDLVVTRQRHARSKIVSGVLRIPPGGSDPKFLNKRAHLDKKKKWGPPPCQNQPSESRNSSRLTHLVTGGLETKEIGSHVTPQALSLSRSRSTRRRILPDALLGISPTKVTALTCL